MASRRDSGNPKGSKRDHHNALERKRRDSIKTSFKNLQDALPGLAGKKVSRTTLIRAAMDFIRETERENSRKQKELEELQRQNGFVEEDIKIMQQICDQNLAAGVSASSFTPEMLSSEGGDTSAFNGPSTSGSLNVSSSDDDETRGIKTEPAFWP